jgi:hypothetical protein
MKPYVFTARRSGRLRWRFTARLFLVNIEEDMPAVVGCERSAGFERATARMLLPNDRPKAGTAALIIESAFP